MIVMDEVTEQNYWPISSRHFCVNHVTAGVLLGLFIIDKDVDNNPPVTL